MSRLHVKLCCAVLVLAGAGCMAMDCPLAAIVFWFGTVATALAYTELNTGKE